MSHAMKPFAVSQRRGLVLWGRAASLGITLVFTLAGAAKGFDWGSIVIPDIVLRPIDDPLPPILDDPIFDPGDGTIDADTYFWANISKARDGVDLHFFLASRLRTEGLFLPGHVVGRIEFPMPLHFDNQEPTIVSIVVVSEGFDLISMALQFGAWVDLDSNGTLDRPASELNILSSVRFGTYLTSPSPHLIVELTVPVAVPSLHRIPVDILPIREIREEPVGIYPVTPAFVAGHLADDAGRLVRVGSALTQIADDDNLTMRFAPAVDRVAPAALIYGTPDSINLRSGGTANAVILSTPRLAAAEVNPFAFRWFDPSDPGEEASPSSAQMRDVNEDGLVDLVLAFDVEGLMSAGILDETSRWAGFRSTQDTRVGATALVRVSAEQLIRRGDSNNDGEVNLTDALQTLGWLFLGSDTTLCADAADTNDDGTLNITDPLATLGWLFLGSVEPAAPGPHACGFDVNSDALPECSADVCAGD